MFQFKHNTDHIYQYSSYFDNKFFKYNLFDIYF